MNDKALSQVSEIEENIIKYMKKYPNHVGNIDFWEGFYACRNVVLQLDDEEYVPKEQEPCDDILTLAERVTTQVTEDMDNFIFTTIKPWCEEKEQRKISKRDLEEALIQYFRKQPCEDAVSREAVINMLDGIIKDRQVYFGHHGDIEFSCGFSTFKWYIEQLPSVTARQTDILDRRIDDKTVVFKTLDGKETEYVKRQTGEWICIDDYHLGKFKCSVCQTEGFPNTAMYKPTWNFCPNCGAKMESTAERSGKE